MALDRVWVRSWPEGKTRTTIALPRGTLPSVGSFLAVSPDGDRLLTMTDFVWLDRDYPIDAGSGSIDLWEMATGRHVHQLASAGRGLKSAELNRAGEIILTSDSQLLGEEDRERYRFGAIHVIDAGTGQLKRIFPLTAKTCSLALTSEVRVALPGQDDGTIDLMDLTTGDVGHRLKGHHDIIYELVVLLGGQRLISVSRDGSALNWDLAAALDRTR